MDSRYRFLTLGTPWTQSMPSRDVNAVTRLAEASWRRDNWICVALTLKLRPVVEVRTHLCLSKGCWFDPTVRHYIPSNIVYLLEYVFTLLSHIVGKWNSKTNINIFLVTIKIESSKQIIYVIVHYKLFWKQKRICSKHFTIVIKQPINNNE